jgi:hypothetical protein
MLGAPGKDIFMTSPSLSVCSADAATVGAAGTATVPADGAVGSAHPENPRIGNTPTSSSDPQTFRRFHDNDGCISGRALQDRVIVPTTLKSVLNTVFSKSKDTLKVHLVHGLLD